MSSSRRSPRRIFAVSVPVAGIAAVITDVVCYRRLSSNRASRLRRYKIGANLRVVAGGYGYGFVLPSGSCRRVLAGRLRDRTQGPHFTTYAVIATWGLYPQHLIEAGFSAWSERREHWIRSPACFVCSGGERRQLHRAWSSGLDLVYLDSTKCGVALRSCGLCVRLVRTDYG